MDTFIDRMCDNLEAQMMGELENMDMNLPSKFMDKKKQQVRDMVMQRISDKLDHKLGLTPISIDDDVITKIAKSKSKTPSVTSSDTIVSIRRKGDSMSTNWREERAELGICKCTCRGEHGNGCRCHLMYHKNDKPNTDARIALLKKKGIVLIDNYNCYHDNELVKIRMEDEKHNHHNKSLGKGFKDHNDFFDNGKPVTDDDDSDIDE